MVDILATVGIMAIVIIWLATIAWAGERHSRAERERLLQANTWLHYTTPQSPAELEQQVAGSREARAWARENPDLARELAEVLAGDE